MLSYNIHLLHGKFEEFRDFIYDFPNKFSIIGIQEVWSVSHEYPINGYQALEYNTHDSHLPNPNCNCGGGVGIYIDEHLTYTKIEFQNSFIPGVF